MYKLLIVDDEPLVQAGIKSMLDWAEMDIEICGTAMNGLVALKMVEEISPDIVITDIKMPVMNGLELAKVCFEQYGSRHPVFIILTSYEDFHMAKEALTYQVANYLVKLELTPESLKEAVIQVIKQMNSEDFPQREIKKDAVHPYYDKFFIRLLHNLFESEEQFLSQSKDLNLNFNYSCYVCCSGELIGASAEALPVKRQLSLFNSSFQILQELLTKYMPCYSVSLDIRHFALIFCYDTVPENNDYEKNIKAILENISTTLFNYYKVTLRCGIGSLVNTTKALCDSYLYSRKVSRAADEEHPIVFPEDGRKDNKNHIVVSVKKYIGENLKERLSLNEVATVFGISSNYLSQLFKKYNDTGFNEYVTFCKINEAKKLLEDSSLKVYEIAEMLGFESAFYFSKVFKKVEGCSPTEYVNSKLL